MRLGKHVLSVHIRFARMAGKTRNVSLVLGIDDELLEPGREVLFEAEPCRDAKSVRNSKGGAFLRLR